MRVLIVEDDVSDSRKCMAVLEKLGAREVEAVSNIPAALLRLEDILENKLPTPDLIILDLHFTMDSGFAVLRRWKEHPRLKDIPVVVWTNMGDTERRLCEYFGVNRFVPKSAGPTGLEQALKASAPG
jgi:CheY-like chemotaxis protein